MDNSLTNVDFLSVKFDNVPFDDLIDQITKRARDSEFVYLVTPNVDHVVRLHDDTAADAPAIAAAYRAAYWTICDSRVLSTLAAHAGLPMTVVPGSDLAPKLLQHFEQLDKPPKVLIVGGENSLVNKLRQQFDAITFCHLPAPMGLRKNSAALAELASAVTAARTTVVFLVIGSPQQELLAHAIAQLPGSRGVGLCVGAALEFVTGERRRAPLFMQYARLEWLFRLLSEPQRLWHRYLISGPRIFKIYRQWRRVRS